MTDDEKAIIAHALGLTRRGRHRARWSSRNSYYTWPDDGLIVSMVAKGYLAKGRRGFPTADGLHGQYFHVTLAGATAAGLATRFRHEDRLVEAR